MGKKVAQISHLTILKMAGFLKVLFFDQLVSCGGLIRAIMQNSSKSAKRFLRYHDFSIFKMAAVRHLCF